MNILPVIFGQILHLHPFAADSRGNFIFLLAISVHRAFVVFHHSLTGVVRGLNLNYKMIFVLR